VSRPTIVLASRELFPFGGGGIGAYVAQNARVLAPVADVTIVTAGWYREKYEELSVFGDPRVDYGGAAVAFVEVPEPHEHGAFYSHMHLYSHRLLERVRELFGSAAPDLIEFSDYLGEGFVATQARRGGDPFLAGTLLALQLHTSGEMCEVLNGHLDRGFERRISRELEPEDVDVVVCFEGLEHLPEVDRVAEQLVRLVRGGVAMIASVPNSATFEEANEFHLTDFDLESARALFAALPNAVVAYQNHAEGSLIRGRAGGTVRAEAELSGEQDLDWANTFLILAGVDAEALLSPAAAALHLAVAPVNHRYMRHLEPANRGLLAVNGRLARERLGLGAAGAASAVLRREDTLALAREEIRQCRHRIGVLEAELESVRAERDGHRGAYVAVHSSRLTNLAARVAGHRFRR